MTRWRISIGTTDGGSREILVEEPTEEAAVAVAEAALGTGETVQGLIEDPDPAPDPDAPGWAAGL